MEDKHRSIRERWVVEGRLLLETPAHFGNGETDALTDMPLLFDEVNNAPLLPGTSIAGALRNFLREFQNNYGGEFPKKENENFKLEHEAELALLSTKLFGSYRGDENGDQSPLIIHDALGISSGIELRDGVKIDPETRTAEDKKKFDIQLLSAGTTFDLRFELLFSGESSADENLKKALATALTGLAKGEITLGARKSRGFGRVTIESWQVKKYDLKNKEGLLAWLTSERPREINGKPTVWKGAPIIIAELLDMPLPNKEDDHRKAAYLTAEFNIDGTLLIRSGFGDSDTGPDTVHLHSNRKNEKKAVPVIPGTSWAGVLRHRALKIARTVSGDEQALDEKGKPRCKKIKVDGKDKDVPLLKAEVFTDKIFGHSEIKKENKDTKASRISIKESEIADSNSLVVTRVKIDRFTGGAYDGALFSEQPVIGKPDLDGKDRTFTPGTRIKLDLILRNPSNSELGLLLLLLKDLWTGDLPIGGESSIGRGRLQGKFAVLNFNKQTWEFVATDEEYGVKLEPSEGATSAQIFVDEFNKIENWTVKHE